MSFNTTSLLWNGSSETFFRDRFIIKPMEQKGPTCVSTVCAMLSGADRRHFQGLINTQDPVTWSDALMEFGLKLAFCATDNRKVKFYIPELLALDDLFTISFYTPTSSDDILRDPRPDDGWVCGSHILILHRDHIIDPARGDRIPSLQHRCLEKFTKRIFRVVPKNHDRGLWKICPKG